eukprot:NODE_3445_length_967_cov_3.135714_g3296_i0.p1 GENE.NODE_3445_length_967_cov_3.135714_g3296_i0~~NODE_3445_length_967_cov_3.135714_g3296_i0.p1  ORF type:complete len:300 (-),score=47.91 NODE_3445_length_967_cov_3.135714_g3296_i0:66-965(-)
MKRAPPKASTTMTAIALQRQMAHNFSLSEKPKNKLTLAQKMGLAAKPAPKLTDEEWAEAQKTSQIRQDSFQPCPICYEPFGSQPQVLLSCSHVFHQTCIRSFERFSETKHCPLCRRVAYQKRCIQDGQHAHRILSSTKIQTVWRGYAARKLYFHLLLEHDPTMRRSYHYAIVKGVSDRYLAASEKKSSELDHLFATLDRARAQANLLMVTPADWAEAAARAKQRHTNECPICMQVLSAGLPDVHRTQEADQVVLLSCSHCFHAKCIQSFEQFALSLDAAPTKLSCPLCRSPYLKQSFQF